MTSDNAKEQLQLLVRYAERVKARSGWTRSNASAVGPKVLPRPRLSEEALISYTYMSGRPIKPIDDRTESSVRFLSEIEY
jgi:hypothetical protein